MAAFVRFISFFVLSILISCSSSICAENSEWKLERDKEGIVVYTRDVADSPIKEFKSITHIKIPFDQMIAFYEDDSKFCDWMDRCRKAAQLEQMSLVKWNLYLHLNFPWPVNDRDVVILRVKEQDELTKAITYTLHEVEGYYPLQNGMIRMPYLRGIWRFTPLEDGRVEIHFQQHVDVGGFVPKWLSNRLVVQIPFHTLQNLKRMLRV